MDGTPRALKPIAEEVLQWVERERPFVAPHELRRIELCAKVALNVANFAELYGSRNLEQSDKSEKEALDAAIYRPDDNKEEPLNPPYLFEGLDAKSQHTS